MKTKILAILMVGIVAMLTSMACMPYVPQKVAAEDIDISRGIDQSMRIPVGGTAPADAPPATIALWVIEPAAGTPIRGTILFLHGFLANHQQVENAAEALRKVGYRGVLIDARGFGASS